jgi:hypothetical protein
MKALAGPKNFNWKGGISKDSTHYFLVQKQRFPEKVRARRILMEAVKSGKMKRGTCETCGSSKDIHGHHDDYSKPLSVRWLCRKHHRELHAS